MSAAISRLSTNIELYSELTEILQRPLDVSKLPLFADCKIFTSSTERYGHVVIKLDLEAESDLSSSWNKYFYKWEVDETEVFPHGYAPLRKRYEEPMILKEFELLKTLLDFLNYNAPHLRFTLIGGSVKTSERPYFGRATAGAIIKIFKQLHP